MGSDEVQAGDSPPSTELEQLMNLCDRVERAWNADESLRIEDIVSRDARPDALLAQLLLLEKKRHARAGDTEIDDESPGRFGGLSSPPDDAGSGGSARTRRAHEGSTPDARLGLDDPTEAGPEPGLWPRRDSLGSTLDAGEIGDDETHFTAGPRPGTGGGGGGGSNSGRERRGRYTLVRKHAIGGFGEVWLARDHALARYVALKRLQPARAEERAVRARFLREAWITGQLQHPGIVPVFDLAIDPADGRAYYTMRFLGGRTLTGSASEHHRQREAGRAGRAELRELLQAFVTACQVMAYAHSRGVIHRDLKGSNIIVGDFGEVMVLDWGTAKVLRGERAPAAAEAEAVEAPATAGGPPMEDIPSDATGDGSVIGTPSYMAPEQAQGRIDLVDERSDVYGLGAILHEILTGEPPFRGPAAQVLRQVANESPPSPRQRRGDVPRALDAICLKCLSRDRAARYASAGELAAEIRRFLSDEPVDAYPEPWPARLRRWAGRHRTLASVAIATLLVATACLSIATALLKVAGDRAEANLGLAMHAINRFFNRVGDAPQLKAHGLERYRQELLTEARSFYEQLPSDAGAGPAVLAERGWSDLQLAKLTDELGDFPEAIRLAARARTTFEHLAEIQPGEARHRAGIALALDSLGDHLHKVLRPDESRAVLEQAGARWEELVREHPRSLEFRRGRVASMNKLGRLLCLAVHDPPAERAVLAACLDACASLLRDAPGSPEVLDQQAEANLLLGYSWAATDLARAEPYFAATLAIREKLAAERTDRPEVLSSLVDSCVLIATTYSNARAPGLVVPDLYRQVREIGMRLVSDHPDVPLLAENLCLIEIIDSHRLARAGEPQAAVEATEKALSRAPRSGLASLYAACCFAIASEFVRSSAGMSAEERDRSAERYQSRAVELLASAHRAGLFLQPHKLNGLRSDDPDLAPLRGRDDFNRLLAEIEATHPPGRSIGTDGSRE
ncbi:serine/threonine-protein kinase [Aquisphaera insulae]|uniref:serine/threonine-protein kinase n=1 Tax=Aquisphaera insulae TaxID=2712864 RepID=UPI0013ECF782|nr:serine/threonine-protein kinase [Aquisphaera insulae]